MDTTKSTIATIAEQVAQVAKALQQQRTGHAPKAVTVVLSEDTLVITMHDALTPAEKALALNSVGASQVQEFHRQLFLASADALAERNQANHRPRRARGGRRSRAGNRNHCARVHDRQRCAGVSALRGSSGRNW